MPSANGVYSLPSGYLAVTGATIQASQHNPPLEDIASALTLRLSRDGTAPMTGALQGIAGTASLPSYVFANAANTGIFKTTNGVGVSVAGTQVAEFTSAGMASGVRLLGEIMPWGHTAAPNALWVFPVGQSLSRTTYATLWAVVQAEIAAGSTFYNNGDGSTTFGLPDLRGRVLAGKDNMGGSAASRLTTANLGIDGTTIGATGGGPYTMLRTDMPNVAPTIDASTAVWNTASFNSTNINVGTNSIQSVVNSMAGGSGGGATNVNSKAGLVGGNIIASSINGNVTQTAMKVMPPAIVCQFLLFIGNPG